LRDGEFLLVSFISLLSDQSVSFDIACGKGAAAADPRRASFVLCEVVEKAASVARGNLRAERSSDACSESLTAL